LFYHKYKTDNTFVTFVEITLQQRTNIVNFSLPNRSLIIPHIHQI